MADMGVEPYLTADSLCGMAAQRLVRKVCPHCAETVELTEEEQKLFGRKIRSARRGRGCEFCRNTGYKGRTAVHEIFVMDRELKKMIAENRPEWEIEDYVVKTQGMRDHAGRAGGSCVRRSDFDGGIFADGGDVVRQVKGRTCAACPVFFDIEKCL